MKESKTELIKAIIIVGKSLEIKEATEFLIPNMGIYATIKELIYKMFTENRQQYFEQNDTIFEAISLMRKYCVEMSKHGEVNFDVPYTHNS